VKRAVDADFCSSSAGTQVALGKVTMNALIKRLARDEEAGTAVEYGLITAVIAIALIVALVAFRDEISAMFGRAGNRIRSTT
jgi:Flp pilus assembly pilin Flp